MDCTFLNENNNIFLTITLNEISILKNSDSIAERINIGINKDKKIVLFHRILEKKDDGIIYSIIQKYFALTYRFGDQVVLTDLSEQRNVITKDSLNILINNFDFNNEQITKMLIRLIMLENKTNLKDQSDYFSEFSTHMNYYIYCNSMRPYTDNIYPTRTYLNGEEISSLYEFCDGPDKLYRVYDLYRGIMNQRNENDLKEISLGLTAKDMYDLKTLRGITEKENYLVGKPFNIYTDDYIDYLKNLLADEFGYKGNLQLNRESILQAITCQLDKYESDQKLAEEKIVAENVTEENSKSVEKKNIKYILKKMIKR